MRVLKGVEIKSVLNRDKGTSPTIWNLIYVDDVD